MVHRPPDSRLLTNLIDHEREYAKHLAALFPLSHAALASLSAYAAASPATPISAVVDVLATANDALHRYTTAVDVWRQQLLSLKDLEDDLAAVLRDRDIFVTRLIKASKSTRDAHRTSRIGSASRSSLTLPSTANSTSVSGPASTNPKLAQAQAELQACEVHLVAKERELDARRISIARDGLGARCQALIDCAWLWGEMGKQGLKALQALGPDPSGPSLTVPKPARRRSTNPTPCASDNSSLTPSQSASQIAARSLEVSHGGQTSKEPERVQPPPEPEPTSKPQARLSRSNDDGDLTLTLPPAHAISELAFPTTVRTQSRPLENGDSTVALEPALRRKRTKRSRRPPSQHIPEVSDEGSDEPNVDARAPPTPFPTSATHDTSSDDEHTAGPLQVVENDPFQVIRRSMLGAAPASPLFIPSAVLPVARASAPDVRASIVAVDGPSKALFPGSSLSVSGLAQGQGTGITLGHDPPPSTRRQRKTSLALFGSLRGLFRKPKERGRIVATEWDESPSSSSPKRTGWVTRTDARIKSRGGQEDSDEEPMQRVTHKVTAMDTTANIARAPSGARLRKGRPSASARAPSQRAGADGWIPDTPGSPNVSTSGAAVSRSRTRGGTMKRKKISVADLRGSDQGHTDGELDGGRPSLQPVLDIGKAKAPEAALSVSAPKTIVEDQRPAAAPTDTNPTAAPKLVASTNPNTVVGAASPQRQAMTVATSSPRSSPDAVSAHLRSASLSAVDTHVTVVSTSASTSTNTTSTGGSMSWRKPPPQVDAQSVSPSSTPVPAPAQPRTHESQSKQNARRHIGNGHAKHVQNQSLMSIVADVTRQSQTRDEDRARSPDLPRAPGSVLREGDREVTGEGRGHTRATSSSEDAAQGQRVPKLPLRSALRNASRTPSPTPAIVPVKKEEEHGRGAVPSAWRDSASVSSYETGRESLNGELPSPVQTRAPPARSQSQPPAGRSLPPAVRTPAIRTPSPPPPFTFPPPPVDPPPVRGASNGNANLNANEPGSSGTSTEAAPVRRKSVRVSLQPTFSPPPPATYDDDDGYRPGRSSGDVWADSSEEEETYSRARRMLRSVGRGKA